MKRIFTAGALCLCLGLLFLLSACGGASADSASLAPPVSEQTAKVPAGSPEALPAESLPAAALTEETVPDPERSGDRPEYRLHFYLEGKGGREEGMLNIAFCPDSRGSDGSPDPTVRVWDSCRITDEAEIRSVCREILASELYDPALYGRTLDSMVTEWVAHNDINRLYDNERTRHVDFNRADEGVSYADFWRRAALAITRRESG